MNQISLNGTDLCVSEDFITLHADRSIPEAMKELIRQAESKDNVTTLFLVDRSGFYLGAVFLKDLIIARAGHSLQSILQKDYPFVRTSDPPEEISDKLRNFSEDLLPVLDETQRIAGVLDNQQIARILEEELEEDYARLAGLSREEPLSEPLMKSLRRRLPWLLILFGLGFLVSGVVGIFEKVISGLTVIVSFQSLILGMAGNGGTQSLAVTIRLLTEGTLDRKQTLKRIGKEAEIGLCNGLVLGFISFVFIGLFLFLFRRTPILFAFSVSGCIGLALNISMLLSGISGTAIPILLKNNGIDPAVASGPFITTVNDLVAVVTYYGLAWILLSNAF